MRAGEPNNIRRGDQPATLKDVLQIVVVLGLLFLIGLSVVICVPNIVSPDPTARKRATETSIDRLSEIVLSYHHDCGLWPSDEAGLTLLYTNLDAVAGWKGPYVNGEGWLSDSWGTIFRLLREGQNRFIVSAGDDGEFGTHDDIKGGPIRAPSDSHLLSPLETRKE